MSNSTGIGERGLFVPRSERLTNVLQDWVLQDWVFQLVLVVAVVGGMIATAVSLNGSIA